jgi:GNAT superfamily N-acetyltransferase
MTTISLAETDADIARCFPVLFQLRPHLLEECFLERVRGQQTKFGYNLAFLHDQGIVRAVAGFRITECLAWGKFLYVDDLVSAAEARFQGHGQRLIEWLLARAREEGCEEFHLDSGVHRFEAHGFYLKNRLHIKAHHFSRNLA